jgi:hypothetical protein
LRYDTDGTLVYPHHVERAPESELAHYLNEAAALIAATDAPHAYAQAQVSTGFDSLRWFDLPASCVAQVSGEVVG